jgi:hypothetical protein
MTQAPRKPRKPGAATPDRRQTNTKSGVNLPAPGFVALVEYGAPRGNESGNPYVIVSWKILARLTGKRVSVRRRAGFMIYSYEQT